MAKMKEDNLTPLAKLRIKSGLSREDASSILNGNDDAISL